MRILFHHRIASRDGQAVHIEEMIAALQRQGHETILVGPSSFTATAFGGSNPLVDRIKRRILGALYELLEIAYSVKAFLRLRAAVRTHRPDVMHERFSLFLFAGIWMRRLSGLPLLLEVNAPLYEERAKNDGLRLHRLGAWAQRLLWNRADHVLPVTGVLARTVAEYGVPRLRITVIPNGINSERFGAIPDTDAAKAALGLPPRLVLGFTGFIRGWNAVHRLHCGPRRRCPPHRRVRHRRAAGFAPYSSPLKLFEYLQLGRSIVAPDTENIREILTDGEDSLLFDPSRDGTLEAALLRLCGDAALRLRLGASARRTIAEKSLTWDRNAERVAGIAEQAIAQARGRRPAASLATPA